MKIKQYWLVTSDSQEELMDKVNVMIKDGWQPLGGVAIRTYMIGTGWTCAQAMVKDQK